MGDLCADGTYYIGNVGNGSVFATSAGNESTETWNNGTTNWVDTAADDGSDGAVNTSILVASGDAGSPYDAAVYCDGLSAHGHDDWYLPAFLELDLLWNNGTPLASVTTDGTHYWASNDFFAVPSQYASAQRFNDGFQASFVDKNNARLVRCVRK